MSKVMVRVLIYNGSQEFIDQHATQRVVKGIYQQTGKCQGTIHEVILEPKDMRIQLVEVPNNLEALK